jgi:hypothetical protein
MKLDRTVNGKPADRAAQMWIALFELLEKDPGGDVFMVRPDGTVLPPFDAGKSVNGPWVLVIDGNTTCGWLMRWAARSRTSAARVPRTARSAHTIPSPHGHLQNEKGRPAEADPP